MRKFLFILTSTAILAMVSHAIAQYVPAPPGYWVYPGAMPPAYVSPGYRWREQQLNQDPRRYNNPVEDNQRRQTIDTTRFGVTDTAKYYAGECAVGSSEKTCRAREQPNFVGECAKGVSEETCRARGQEYNPKK